MARLAQRQPFPHFNQGYIMNKSGLLAVGAAIFLCLSLIIPGSCESASHKTSHHKTTKVATKTVKKSVAKSGKKSQAKAGAASKADNAQSERDVWLKRAQASEALTGKASWYGKDFHNKATASGLAYDMHTFTAAHRTLPLGTVVKVTDQNNGKSALVCVTDRGPFIKDRIIDLSYAAAKQIDLQKRGVGKVALEVVSDANGSPLKKDQAFFVKYGSGNGRNKVGPFHAFADAAAMHEALSQAHPEAEMVVEKDRK